MSFPTYLQVLSVDTSTERNDDDEAKLIGLALTEDEKSSGENEAIMPAHSHLRVSLRVEVAPTHPLYRYTGAKHTSHNSSQDADISL